MVKMTNLLKWQKYGKMSKIVIFWQNVKMVLFDVFEEFVYGINVENVIFCRIYIVEMWISWSWRIKRIIFTNNMMKVRSIMTVDLLKSDKSSVSKLCGYRLHSVSPSLDQLTDESATNQIGRSWFWGALSGVPIFIFPVWGAQVSTCRRCMYMQEQRRCCVPWSRTNGDSTWWNEFFRKSTLGCAGIIMVYHITLTILNLTLYPLIQLEKLSFLLAMAMRFVIIK